MDKNVKIALITALAVIGVILAYRLLFVRTVSYDVGGIKIPSKYNTLTGKATPIKDYKGPELKTTDTDRDTKKIGLDSTEVVTAQVRWAVFEEWAKAQPEYKGWESDPEVFKQAQAAFLDYMEKSGRKVTIIK